MTAHPLKALRARAGLSQSALAALVGVTVHTVASIEAGRLGLSQDLADRIALATGLDPTNGLELDRHAYIQGRLEAMETQLRRWIR